MARMVAGDGVFWARATAIRLSSSIDRRGSAAAGGGGRSWVSVTVARRKGEARRIPLVGLIYQGAGKSPFAITAPSLLQE